MKNGQLEQDQANREPVEQAPAAQPAARPGERRINDVLTAITDCYFRLDQQLCYVEINPPALDFLAQPVERLLGEPLWVVDPTLSGSPAGERFRGALASQEPAHFEYLVQPVGRWAEVHVAPYTNGIDVYFKDISDRKRAEQNNLFLRHIGDRLITILDPQAVMACISEEVGAYLAVDLAFMSQATPGELEIVVRNAYYLGQSGFADQWRLDEHVSWANEALLKGDTIRITDAGRDARTMAYFEKTAPIGRLRGLVAVPTIKEGKWAGLLVVCTQAAREWRPDEVELLESLSDLAWLAMESAQSHQELRKAEERFRVALASAPVTVFTTDKDLRFTWFYNPEIDLNTPQFLYRRGDEIFPLALVSEPMALMQSALESQLAFRGEVQLPLGEHNRSYLVTVEPLHDAEGRLLGLTGSALDMTVQRRLEARHQVNTSQMEVQRRLLTQRETERVQIARDLHDGPIQDLIGLRFSIQSVREACADPALRERMNEISHAAQALVDDLRGVCNELRPPTLMKFGLSKAIQAHAKEFQRKNSAPVLTLELDADNGLLSDVARLTLYRIYQESLNNILRHARARQVEVRLVIQADEIVLEVWDDGVGLVVQTDWVELARQGHLGLVGMKERAEAAGGKLEVTSTPGQGTRVRVRCPRI